MKNNIIRLFAISTIVAATSCNFNKSINKDFATGLKTTGDGISASSVDITVNNEEASSDKYTYGQTIVTTFNDIDGFTVEDGKYFPKMAVAMVSKKGDTVFANSDLLPNSASGLSSIKRQLKGQVILANPILSGDTYNLIYTISDLKGDGVFVSKMPVELIKDSNIKISSEKLGYSEGYIMSATHKSVITNRKVGFNDKLLFIFEGLKGFTTKDGFVELGMTMTVEDYNGTVILDQPDMFLNQKATQAQVSQSIQASLVLTKGTLENPLKWHIKIWDKNSKAKITAETLLEVE
ncbi:hypothetical protein [Cellulophaga fucicola]|uniref:Uncharacterized protein n=1 Tax=Cellulophaga fucicola TaxID=76595 RepID=A0A1K1P5E9_9FLAO|nr:hypothetical protein [Cellulophaga fucicola]SFW41910.1 hypothetical protein SAMN05660313_01568 [Cellulophaga fucicola]